MFELDGNDSTLTEYWEASSPLDNPSGDFAWVFWAAMNRTTSGTNYFMSQSLWGANYGFNVIFYNGNRFSARVGASGEIFHDVTPSDGQPWVLCAGVSGSNTRFAITRAGASVTAKNGGVSNVVGTAPGPLTFGCRNDYSGPRGLRNQMGQVLHLTHWPSEEELQAFSNRVHPLLLWGESADFYWPAYGHPTAHQYDWIGGRTITNSGSGAPAFYDLAAPVFQDNVYPIGQRSGGGGGGGGITVVRLSGDGGLAGHGGLAGRHGGLAA